MTDSDFESRLEEMFTALDISGGQGSSQDAVERASESPFDELFSAWASPDEKDNGQAEQTAPSTLERTTEQGAMSPDSESVGQGRRQVRIPHIRRRRRASPTRFLKDMFKRRRLTLSFEAAEARLLVVRGQHILHWDQVSLPAGAVRNGQIVQPTAFGQAIAGLIEQAGAPRRRAVVGLSGQRALVRILRLPAVPPRLLDEAVRREARRELPLPLEELHLSWQIIGDRRASHIQVFTLGIPREAIDNCLIGLHGVGVRPRVMDLKPLALVRAVNLPDVLIADVETETESVVLVRGFVPHIVRSVALPGGGARSAAERADHMVAEIQRILDFYGSTQAAEHLPWSPAICLTGALGDEKATRAKVGARWPLVDPNPPIPLPPEEFPLLPYLANVGLALKSLS